MKGATMDATVVCADCGVKFEKTDAALVCADCRVKRLDGLRAVLDGLAPAHRDRFLGDFAKERRNYA
jgi:DNA-directed RNA polymerase subunit RPC12/RpoP